MAKRKRNLTQQEKNEIRRQAYASSQGKIRNLNAQITNLMEVINRLEHQNRKLAQENSRLNDKVIDFKTKLSIMQDTLGMSNAEIEERANQAQLYYRYTNMLTPLLGGSAVKNIQETVENTLDAIQ